MAGITIPNMGAAQPNALEAFGAAFNSDALAKQNADLNKQGWEVLAPYVQAMSKNPALAQSQPFTRNVESIARKYRIDPTLVGQAIQQLRGQGGQPAGQMGPQGTGQNAVQPSGQTTQQPAAQPQQSSNMTPQQRQQQMQSQPRQQQTPQQQQPSAQPAGPTDGQTAGQPGGQPDQLAGLPQAQPAAMQALMAAAGLTPSGLQAFGAVPLSKEQAQYIGENTDPGSGGRAAAYAQFGVDPRSVPAAIMNAKRVPSEGQLMQQRAQVVSQIPRYISQGLDPVPLIQGAIRSGAMDEGEAQAWLSNPEFLGQMRDVAKQHLDALKSTGLLRQAQYDRALAGIQQADTMVTLNTTRNQLLGKQLQYFDQNEQLKVNEKTAQIAHIGQMIQDSQTGNYGTRARLAQQAATDAQQTFNTLFNAGARAQAAGGDPSEIPVGNDAQGNPIPFATALQAAKDAKDQALENLKNTTKNGPGQAVTTAVHTASSNVTVKGGKKAEGGYNIGQVYSGMKYTGGDPNVRANWTKE